MCEYRYADDKCVEYYSRVMVDYFIANGVTIRERGEWKRQKGRPEAICPFCEREVVYKVEDNRWWFEDFCPHCGADMRGVKDE